MSSGEIQARARFRDFDGRTRLVSETAATHAAAERALKTAAESAPRLLARPSQLRTGQRRQRVSAPRHASDKFEHHFGIGPLACGVMGPLHQPQAAAADRRALPLAGVVTGSWTAARSWRVTPAPADDDADAPAFVGSVAVGCKPPTRCSVSGRLGGL